MWTTVCPRTHMQSDLRFRYFFIPTLFTNPLDSVCILLKRDILFAFYVHTITYPICSMVLEYLHTCTLNIAQFCRQIFQHHGAYGCDIHNPNSYRYNLLINP